MSTDKKAVFVSDAWVREAMQANGQFKAELEALRARQNREQRKAGGSVTMSGNEARLFSDWITEKTEYYNKMSAELEVENKRATMQIVKR